MRLLKITTDNYPLYLALASTAVSLVAYLLSAFLRGDDVKRKATNLAGVTYMFSAGCIAYTSVYLMQQILSLKRYDIDYIFRNSGPNDEFIYRISSFWAGSQGSLLFWALCGAVVGLILARKRNFPAPITMAFWACIQLFFLVMLVIGDPFQPYVDYQAGVVGMGLKPLLKNPWMAIHPPIVFLGYAALMVPAALAIQALVKRDIRGWASRALPWAVFGWTALGAGLILGMVWSYQVLGWGGYWGWDPAENSSLIPWLTATALVHGLILQRYKARMAWPNVVLALGTSLLVIYSTFLTRSGVLTGISVHSFEDLGTYGYLLGFLIFYAVLCAGLVAADRKSRRPTPQSLPEFSKDFYVVLGVIVIALFALIVLAGTSQPLFTGKGVQPASYTLVSIAIAVTSVVLIILASIVGWSHKGSHKSTWHFSNALWKSGSHISHLGLLLMILGMVLAATGRSAQVSLPEGGSARPAMGYDFRFIKFDIVSDTKASMDITASRGSKTIAIPLNVEMTAGGALWKPQVISTLAGDTYIAPGGIEPTTVTPELRFSDAHMLSKPVQIPESDSTVRLLGMNVNKREATLEYKTPGSEPVRFAVSQNQPVQIDGYELSFDGFTHEGDSKRMGNSAGVKISLVGNGLSDKAIIKVSSKPFISLLWIGAALIVLGGLLASWRRFREKRTPDDGILPDSL